MSDNQRHNKKGQYRTLCSLSHCKLSVMTRTRVLVVILTHTDSRNFILKFLVTLIFEDYTHKRISALTKPAECQLTLSILFSQLYYIFCIHVYFWCLQYTTYFTKYKLTLLNNRGQARYICRHLLVAQFIVVIVTAIFVVCHNPRSRSQVFK